LEIEDQFVAIHLPRRCSRAKEFDTASGLGNPLIGAGVAFGVGILALTFLIKISKMGKMFNFSYYCCRMGIVMTILA
jgi:undecaprenyl pyrophosphate phosphatase UppP